MIGRLPGCLGSSGSNFLVMAVGILSRRESLSKPTITFFGIMTALPHSPTQDLGALSQVTRVVLDTTPHLQ